MKFAGGGACLLGLYSSYASETLQELRFNTKELIALGNTYKIICHYLS